MTNENVEARLIEEFNAAKDPWERAEGWELLKQEWGMDDHGQANCKSLIAEFNASKDPGERAKVWERLKKALGY